MAYQIPSSFYDGLMHRLPFTVGDDFAAKYQALREDGFTVAIRETEILACKIVCGEPLPEFA